MTLRVQIVIAAEMASYAWLAWLVVLQCAIQTLAAPPADADIRDAVGLLFAAPACVDEGANNEIFSGLLLCAADARVVTDAWDAACICVPQAICATNVAGTPINGEACG